MHYKVVIVGGGMAGLAAARQLFEQNISDILILEASNRAGGRILSQSAGDGLIELGAQWLHDNQSALYHFALQHNLISKEASFEARGIFIRNDGYIYDELLPKQIQNVVGEILDELDEYTEAESIYPVSVGDYLEKQFERRLGESKVEGDMRTLWWELFDWNLRFQEIDNSCATLMQLSAREWGHYESSALDGQGHINIEGGYTKLIATLLSTLPSNIIRYNTAVNTLNYDNNKILIECDNEDVFSADHVILTSSIGVLKANTKLFDNLNASSELTTAIDSFGFGGMGKIFLEFDEKWWNVEGYQLTWKRNATIPSNVGKWVRYLSGFDDVLNQSKMLMGWLGDLGVKEMEELDEESVGRQCVDLLKSFLKRNDIPYPIKVYKSKWTTNSLIRGAYSYTTVANDQTGTNAKSLTLPIYYDNVPRVLFAGEAANQKQFSTTHGAYASGAEQANVILQFYK